MLRPVSIFPTAALNSSAAVLLFAAVPLLAQGEEAWRPLPAEPIQRIAFGSCAKHWQPQPIWDAIIAKQPDLFLFIGDNIYADTDGTTAWTVTKGQLTGEWNRLADKPEFQKARAAFPFLATWDNHDYGSHAGGAEVPTKHDAKECFLTFFGEPKTSPRWTRNGIYGAKILGPEGKRVQIILLDTKFNRSAFKKDTTPKEERLKAGKVGGYLPDDDPSKTHSARSSGHGWNRNSKSRLNCVLCVPAFKSFRTKREWTSGATFRASASGCSI